MEQFDIALIGGDERIVTMQPYLIKAGYRVVCYGTCFLPEEEQQVAVSNAGSLEEALQARHIVVGIPFVKKGLVFAKQDLAGLKPQELCDYMREGQNFFGGILPDDFVRNCSKKGISCYDFMKNEALAVYNAIATAEGAILEALLHQKTNLHKSKSVVLGFGRCGKVLAEKLKGLDAEVTVCARNEVALANVNAFGMNTLELNRLGENICDFEYIFNTVPAILLKDKILKNIRKDALIIDLASAPGGVDFDCARRLGLNALSCLGLPGKYASRSSAKGLSDFVITTVGCTGTK